MSGIDFVVTWVDGNDPEWQKERALYIQDLTLSANTINRYRDWDLMKYWFRGVEKFTPWVDCVHLITCGHYPEWLNLSHPKLHLVKHSDYIPSECLPTYNSNVIELYLHKIEELSEQFVLFNDDTFIINTVKQTDFFRDGLPCDMAILGVLCSLDTTGYFSHTLLNNTAIINKNFDKKSIIKKYWKKFFSFKYGVEVIRNISLLPFRYFSVFHDMHIPSSHLKRTYYEVWEREPEILSKCGTQRFRSSEDVNHWLMKWWRFCKGEFVPRSNKWGKCFEIGRDADMLDAIRKQKYKAICVNDSDPNLDFEFYQKELIAAFEAILPEKSSFEI